MLAEDFLSGNNLLSNLFDEPYVVQNDTQSVMHHTTQNNSLSNSLDFTTKIIVFARDKYCDEIAMLAAMSVHTVTHLVTDATTEWSVYWSPYWSKDSIIIFIGAHWDGLDKLFEGPKYMIFHKGELYDKPPIRGTYSNLYIQYICSDKPLKYIFDLYKQATALQFWEKENLKHFMDYFDNSIKLIDDHFWQRNDNANAFFEGVLSGGTTKTTIFDKFKSYFQSRKDIHRIIADGRLIIASQKNLVRSRMLYSGCYRKTVDGEPVTAAIVNSLDLIDLCHAALREKYPLIDLSVVEGVIYTHDYDNNLISYDYRSYNDKIDAGKIARKYGGNGSKTAASFTVPGGMALKN